VKRNLYYGILCIFAMLCASLVIAQTQFSSLLQSAAAFPFEPIGVGLRMLSLSGTAGNIAAVVLYVLTSLLPIFWLIAIRFRRSYYPEDSIAVVLSVLLFVVLYVMVNPGLITNVIGISELIPIGKAMLGGLIWSAAAGYLVLRLLRIFFSADQRKLLSYFIFFLYVLGIVCVCISFGPCLSELLEQVKALYTANKGTENGLLPTCIFLAIRYIGSVLPYLLDVIVIESAIRLLTLQHRDPDDTACVSAAQKLSVLCGRTLAITVVTTIAINLLQLLCAGMLRDIHETISFPVFSVGMVLVLLLFARYIEENRQLKDDNRQLKEDNDLFI